MAGEGDAWRAKAYEALGELHDTCTSLQVSVNHSSVAHYVAAASMYAGLATMDYLKELKESGETWLPEA